MPYKDAAKQKESNRVYYLAHKEKANASTKKWYHKNHEYCLESKTKWRKQNPFKAKAVSLICNAQKRAASKGIECSISMDWVAYKLEKGCMLSGLPFNMNPEGKVSPFSPSLDRIDLNGGYTENNTQVILQGINGLKLTGTNTDVIFIAKAICKFNEGNGQSERLSDCKS